MRQEELFGWQITNGGLRNLRKKVENWKKKKLKDVNYRMVFMPLNLAASRIGVTMIGWTGACFYFSFPLTLLRMYVGMSIRTFLWKLPKYSVLRTM